MSEYMWTEFYWDCDPYNGRLSDGTAFTVRPGDTLFGEETESGIDIHFHLPAKENMN